MLYRFVVCVDIDAANLTAAYAELYAKMAATSRGWETSDEAYSPDGEAIDPDELQAAITGFFESWEDE